MSAVLINHCMSQNMTNAHFLNSCHISLLLSRIVAGLKPQENMAHSECYGISTSKNIPTLNLCLLPLLSLLLDKEQGS